MRAISKRSFIQRKHNDVVESFKGLLYYKQSQYNDEQKIVIAFKTYNELHPKDKQNATIINLLLKLCLNTKHPEKATIIWEDIKESNIMKTKPISYPLLIKCYLQITNKGFDVIHHCLQILEYLKVSQYKIPKSDVKDYSINISKLISKCDDANQVINIHSLINHINDIDDDIYIKTALINKYGYFKQIGQSLALFESINDNEKDTVVIGAIMTALINNDQHQKALELYDKHHALQNNVVHLLGIQTCIKLNDFAKGKNIHSKISVSGNNISDVNLKNCLIDFYGHFADVISAIDIFENGPKDVITVNCMMTVLINNAKYDDALSLYDTFNSFHNDISHTLAIKACRFNHDSNYYTKGKAIHSRITSKIQTNTHLANTLIEFYAHFDDLNNALSVYEQIKCEDRDIYTIIGMMKLFVNSGFNEKALLFYDDICDNLKSLKYFNKGIQIYKDHNVQSMNVMIDFYSHFGDVPNAENLFNFVSTNNMNVLTLNAMLKAYVDNHCYDKALVLYDEYDPITDDVSHVLGLKSCTNINNLEKGIDIHAKIKKKTNRNNSVFIQTALIDLYGNLGDMDKAVNIFSAIDAEKQNIVVINAMMNAYCNANLGRECINLFRHIALKYELKADCISYATVLKACTQTTAVYVGEQIHDSLKLNGNQLMLSHVDIQINLINFYGKCAKLNICDDIFDDIKQNEPEKLCNEIAIWNAYIQCYCRNGNISKSKEIFTRMKDSFGIKPDEKTFSILMNGCNYCGDVDEAINIWENEIDSDDKHLKYDRYIITSLIDCFCRKGVINKGKELIIAYETYCESKANTMKYDKLSNEAMWMSLLNGCKMSNDNHKDDNRIIAHEIYNEIEKRFQNDEHRMSAASVILSNIYASLI